MDNSDMAQTLIQTTRLYLETGMRVEATARAMFLHANTLRYRLGRFEELTGSDLKDSGISLRRSQSRSMWLPGRCAMCSHGLEGILCSATASFRHVLRQLSVLLTVFGASSPASTSSTISAAKLRTTWTSIVDSRIGPKYGLSRRSPDARYPSRVALLARWCPFS